MTITVSTHLGNSNSISLEHNRRERRLIDSEIRRWQEKHPGDLRIDPTGKHETWQDSPSIEHVYKELFQESIQEWNEKQRKHRHPERCIENYYQSIKAQQKNHKSAKKTAYEMIYTISNAHNPIPEEIAEKILREVYETFAERNPNMQVVGAYYHADEWKSEASGLTGAPHLHLTFIPYTTTAARGPRIANSLSGAIREMGISTDACTIKRTPQMLWEARENANLESICQRYGYEVIHPQRDSGVLHISAEEYRTQRLLQERQEQIDKMQQLPAGLTVVTKAKLEQLQETEKEYKKILTETTIHRRDSVAAVKALEVYAEKFAELERKEKNLDAEINLAANRKTKAYQEQMRAFMVARGLAKEFEQYQKQQQMTMKKIIE